MTTPSNPILLGGNSQLSVQEFSDLWLPVWSGEVLTAFDEYFISSPMVRRKTIPSGVEMQFPRLGQAEAETHQRGAKLLGLDIERGETLIRLDERPLVHHFRVDDIDQLMTHFETRSEFSRQSGLALARQTDRYNYRLMLNASRVPQDGNSDFPGGGYNLDGGAYEDADFGSPSGDWDNAAITAILKAIDAVVMHWDDEDIPESGRHCVIPIRGWHALRQFGVPKTEADLTNYAAGPLFADTQGTYGSQPNPNVFSKPARSSSLQYNGVSIWGASAKQLPFGQNFTTGEAKYQGDFSNSRGIMVQEEAIGHLTLLNTVSEAERDVSRQDWLFLTKVHVGGGTVRQECAVELAVPAA